VTVCPHVQTSLSSQAPFDRARGEPAAGATFGYAELLSVCGHYPGGGTVRTGEEAITSAFRPFLSLVGSIADWDYLQEPSLRGLSLS